MILASDFVASIARVLYLCVSTVALARPPVFAQSANTHAASETVPSASASPSSDISTPEPAETRQEKDAQAALIKESQNPIGNITLIQFQNNVNYGYGSYIRDQYDLNFQPVVPFELTHNLSLVARFITPFVDQPSSASPGLCASTYGCPSTFGIGDLNPQFFLAPKTKPNTLIWGVGPQFLFPTGSGASGPVVSGRSSSLSAGKYGAGPAIVGLVMPGNMVAGVLVAQMFSYAGNAKRANISSLFVQPFFDYDIKTWAIFFGSSGIAANWEAAPLNRWLVPIGTGVTKTFRLDGQTMQLGIFYFGNVVRPVGTAYGTVRLNYSLVYPITRGR